MASKEYFVPSEEVMTSIVLPTIIFCIGMVVAMLIGINKCKQWELDKIVEMRRTRRVMQRITARCGSSPPPSYEDALLDEYYYECQPSTSRSTFILLFVTSNHGLRENHGFLNEVVMEVGEQVEL
uniref:Col_cuticle_N domain-containing protein n=1 Tax=Heterorhabditis bacteriophora TaxID=37862 RepID=A0A1I7XHN0_HETBA